MCVVSGLDFWYDEQDQYCFHGKALFDGSFDNLFQTIEMTIIIKAMSLDTLCFNVNKSWFIRLKVTWLLMFHLKKGESLVNVRF